MTPDALETIQHPRYPLTSVTARDLVSIGMWTGLITLVYILFHFLGSPGGLGDWGTSIYRWLVNRWQDSGISMGSGDYSHGFLVPLASLYIVWRQRDSLIHARTSTSWIGLLGVVGSLVLHYLGYKTQLQQLSAVAFIGLLWTMPFYLFGWQVAKQLMFPCAFLIFAVPLNFLDSLTFPLRIVSTACSVEILQFLGLDVKQVGTAIYGPPYDASATLKLDVADPCSGIRSLTAMMALTAIYGFLALQGIWRRWVLFLCAIPLAMAGNIFRIVSIGIMAEAVDTRLATGLPHDYAGFIVFGFAIALMVGLSVFLNRDFHLPGRPDVRF